MARAPLQVLLRLRGTAVDAARGELSALLAKEHHASAAARRAEARIAEEMAQANRIEADDGAVEAFARWLPRGRAAALRTRALAEEAQADCTLARARLSAARAAHEAVKSALSRQAQQEQAAVARAEQAVLDEAGSRRSTSSQE